VFGGAARNVASNVFRRARSASNRYTRIPNTLTITAHAPGHDSTCTADSAAPVSQPRWGGVDVFMLMPESPV